ncbi:unnamed protein product [Auanema sp. JU1783]|nr:unnamed protein product [Auanema sp. JU1783]
MRRRTLELFIGRKVRECQMLKSQWYEEHMYSEEYYDCPKTTLAPVPKFILHPILRVGEKDCYGRPSQKNNHRIFETMLRDFFTRTGFYNHTVHLFALKCFYSGGITSSLSILLY